MRPYIFFEGGGASDARRSDRAAPCLPPAPHCSVLFCKRRGGRGSSAKETRLLTRMVCLCPHARSWVKRKDLNENGRARREILPAAPAQERVTGLLAPSSCSAPALFHQQRQLSGEVCIIRLKQFSLPSHLLLTKTLFFQQPHWVYCLEKGWVLEKAA